MADKQNVLRRIAGAAKRLWNQARAESRPVSVAPHAVRHAPVKPFAADPSRVRRFPARVIYRDEWRKWHPAIALRRDFLGRVVLTKNLSASERRRGTPKQFVHPRSLVRPAGWYGIEGL